MLEGWAGDYYGIPVQSTLDAIRLTGQLEGMIIDPVYEGKSMAGLIDLVTAGEIGRDSTVLYAHLGGQPALNAYSALFRIITRDVTTSGSVPTRAAAPNAATRSCGSGREPCRPLLAGAADAAVGCCGSGWNAASWSS